MSLAISGNLQSNLMQLFAYIKDLLLDLENEAQTSENVKNQLLSLFSNKHPSLCAYIIQFLKSKERKQLIELLDTQLNPEVLNYLDDTIQKEICNTLASHKLADMLSRLKETEASEILENLTPGQLKTLLPSFNYFFRKSIEKVMNFPENSAGKIMDHKVISVPEGWTVSQIKNFVKSAHYLPKYLNTIFLVDKNGSPIGQISLTEIIRLEKNSHLTNKISKIDVVFSFLTPISEVIYSFNQYNLYCAPVVDENNVLIGIIHISTVLDLAQEEAEENLMYSAGIYSSDFHESLLKSSWNRMRWLSIGVTMASIISVIMDHYIEPSLLAIATIVTSICGSFAVQVVTIIVNALNNRDLFELNLKRSLFKEFSVAFIVSIGFSSIISVGFYYLNYSFKNILILDLALIISLTLSALVGVIIPFILFKFDIDPGLGSGGILTSITDLLSICTFILISNFILARMI